jgi:hypothetical protein
MCHRHVPKVYEYGSNMTVHYLNDQILLNLSVLLTGDSLMLGNTKIMT